MSGIWFGLATAAVGLVIRWYILGEAKLSRPKVTRGNLGKEK